MQKHIELRPSFSYCDFLDYRKNQHEIYTNLKKSYVWNSETVYFGNPVLTCKIL